MSSPPADARSTTDSPTDSGAPHDATTDGPAGPRHARHDLDPLLLHGVRFSVLAIAVAGDKVAFAYVRDTLQVSDSVLSKQLTALEDASYLRVSKVAEGRRARTWLHPTDAGRAAFRRHREALTAIAEGS